MTINLIIQCVLILIVVILSIWIRHRKLSKKLQKLRKSWGEIPETSLDIKLARLYCDLNNNNSDDSCYCIDDATWHDLDLNDIFPLIDRTTSPIGSQYLFNLLKHPVLKHDVLDKREEHIEQFSENSHLREQVQLKLQQLASNQSSYLPYSLWKPLPDKPLYAVFLPVMSFVSMAILLLAIFGYVHFSVPIILFAINIFIRSFVKRKIDMFMYSVLSLGDLIHTAKNISTLNCTGIDSIQKRLIENLNGSKSLAQKIYALQFVDGLGVTEYLNIYFLWDISEFYSALGKIKKHLPKLREIYKTVGYLDALIAIASFRLDYDKSCRPSFSSASNRYAVNDIYNPLLKNPVTNSFVFDNNNVLITGSNMAGKTTFLKTIGVNAILAQTINVAMAQQYEAPFIKVVSSIAREDNLIKGRSYYLAEIESILGLIKASQSDYKHLFILDEIYRGTNSTERLAASIAVLDFMANGKDYILVATHDLKLSEMLNHKYHNFHFQESVNNEGLVFDYKIRSGVSTTRNAITLLKHAGYPISIVKNAFDRINKNSP